MKRSLLRRLAALLALGACGRAPAPAADTAAPDVAASSAPGPNAAAATPAPPSASATPGAPAPAVTPPGDTAWVALFDGTPASLGAHWRGYKRLEPPAAWRVEDGALALVPGAGPAPAPGAGTGGDLVTRDTYGDFELEYAWRVSPGGNSGVMWRVSEDQAFPWETGPEQQVLDDGKHLDGKIPSHRAGALYDLVVPPPGLTRPVGEFNRARVVARGSRVQLFLNGRQTADFDFASDSGRSRVKASKFGVMPGFARNAVGHIVLQDHGDRVWFRDVRVRRLRGAAGGTPAGTAPGGA